MTKRCEILLNLSVSYMYNTKPCNTWCIFYVSTQSCL